MIIEDWHDEAAYRALADYDGPAWAWAFLRRNPGYQAEWAEFNCTWQALEAAYGRPPDRDFCAWKNDPRAWIRAEEDSAVDCRVDHDKVLIECAFGARWGFHKFPPDPMDADAAREQRISWREPPPPERLLAPGSVVGDDIARAALSFDLGLPLKPQIEQAKRELAVEQRRRQREQGLRLRSIANLADTLLREVRLLDAEAAGELPAALELPGFAAVLAGAMARRDGAYRELSWLPMKWQSARRCACASSHCPVHYRQLSSPSAS